MRGNEREIRCMAKCNCREFSAVAFQRKEACGFLNGWALRA